MLFFFSMKDKIINAVIEIGTLQGIENVTNKSVAEKCGMTPANIYYHFKDRYDMILKAAMHVAIKEVEVMNNAYQANENYENNYKNILIAVAKHYNKKEYRNHVGYLVRATGLPPTALRPNDIETLEQICRMNILLHEGIKNGKIRNLDNIMQRAYLPFCMYLYSIFISRKKLNYKKLQDIIDSLWLSIAP